MSSTPVACAVPEAASVMRLGRLHQLERVIERGLTTFIEVGLALQEIREQRLYKPAYSTFQHYCAERWGWTRIRAHQLIDAARVVGVLTAVNTATPLPTSERQARELAPLADDAAALSDAWREARERYGEDPTADELRAVVRGTDTGATSALAPSGDPLHELLEAYDRYLHSDLALKHAAYEQNDIRQIVLYFAGPEFPRMLDELQLVMGASGTGTHSEAVQWLVDRWCAEATTP